MFNEHKTILQGFPIDDSGADHLAFRQWNPAFRAVPVRTGADRVRRRVWRDFSPVHGSHRAVRPGRRRAGRPPSPAEHHGGAGFSHRRLDGGLQPVCRRGKGWGSGGADGAAIPDPGAVPAFGSGGGARPGGAGKAHGGQWHSGPGAVPGRAAGAGFGRCALWLGRAGGYSVDQRRMLCAFGGNGVVSAHPFPAPARGKIPLGRRRRGFERDAGISGKGAPPVGADAAFAGGAESVPLLFVRGGPALFD